MLDDEQDFPDRDDPRVVPLHAVRDQALSLFSRMMSEQCGAKEKFCDNTIDDSHRAFLSIAETENILMSFCAAQNDEVIAIGGDSHEEMMAQMHQLLNALITRIISNVVAEGVKRDLIDSEFDSEHNCFAFSVTEKGLRLVAEKKEYFEDCDDDPQPEQE